MSRQTHQLTPTLRQGGAGQLPPQVPLKQAAQFFGVDVRTVRRWISDGRLVAYRVGPRLIRVDRDSVLRLAQPVGGAV